MRAALLGLALLAGCHEKEEVTRAAAAAASPSVVEAAKPRSDRPTAEPTAPDREPRPLAFDQRSIPEGNRLVEEGLAT